MLDHFNKSRVKHFDTLTNEELMKEKELAETHYSYLQSCSSLTPVIATTMMGKLEWYVAKILGEMEDRGLPGGFKYRRKPQLIPVRKRARCNGLFLPLM